MIKLATFQQLRTFDPSVHPVNLEPGQFALNLSEENFEPDKGNFNCFIYVGNGSNSRVDEGGTVLVNEGSPGKGWVRYSLRNLGVNGDTIYGDFTVAGSRLKFQSFSGRSSELVVPKISDTPLQGTLIGSVRWNTNSNIFEAWSGNKWDTTSKVVVSEVAPPNPSSGDLWFKVGTISELYVYVDRQGSPPVWIPAFTSLADTALQPGNGITSNSLNQISIIDQGGF